MRVEEVTEELWAPLRFTRSEIEDVLSKGRMSAWVPEWADNLEAAKLTLAAILLNATRIQIRRCRKPPLTRAQYQKVLRLSERLSAAIKELQESDDPPPPLETDDKGRTPWENWARLDLLLTPGGRPPMSDPYAVSNLTAFYQLALGRTEGPGFSWDDDAPLRRFLSASLECAQARLLAWQAKNDVPMEHSLHVPKPAALSKLVQQQGGNMPSRRNVERRFTHFREQILQVRMGQSNSQK